MLEIKQRGLYGEGRGYLGNCASLNRGCFVKLNPSDATFNHNSSPTGAANTYYPGYAPSGGRKYVPATSGDGMNTLVYIMGKYFADPTLQDVADDAVISGQGIVVYEDGQFETDQYASTQTWTGLAPGTPLYLNGSSQLATGVDTSIADAVPRAIFLGLASNYDSKYSARKMLWIQKLPNFYVYSGEIPAYSA